jgi:predicted GNAT superfamily acetyltransferase
MGPAISELHELHDLRELERLFAAVWELPNEPPIGSDVMKALAHSGNYVAGAREGSRLVGGLVGWLGGTPPHETADPIRADQVHGRTIGAHMHSHILGVVADAQVRGLGFELKQHQRRWCLDRGIKVVEWTTDPLVRRNAHFNLTKLGAEARQYLVNFYGEMIDGLNAGEESDRLLIRWRLDSKQVEAAATGSAPEPEVDKLLREGAAVVLSVGPSGEPVAGSLFSEVLLCQVPEDIVSVRRANPGVAHAWRMESRRVLSAAFDAGYRISGATRTGWYVLAK